MSLWQKEGQLSRVNWYPQILSLPICWLVKAGVLSWYLSAVDASEWGWSRRAGRFGGDHNEPLILTEPIQVHFVFKRRLSSRPRPLYRTEKLKLLSSFWWSTLKKRGKTKPKQTMPPSQRNTYSKGREKWHIWIVGSFKVDFLWHAFLHPGEVL